jgi:hypothetical protein
MPLSARILPVGLLLPISVAAACGRGDALAITTKAPPPSAASQAPAARVAGAAEEHAPEGVASAIDSVVVATGAWSENRLYRVRLERVDACGAAAETLGPAQAAAAGGARRLRGESSWVGAFFRVEAKEPSMFVSPRDLELKRGGVILNARYVNQPLLAGCSPLLPAKRLRAGESAAGFALFEVPSSFRAATDDPIVLSYRPTRWGGARRVEVPIRECFDACVTKGRAAGTE